MIDIDALVLANQMKVYGRPVSYRPLHGPEFATVGIFNRAYMETKITDQGVPFSTREPVISIREATFPPGVEAKQGDHLTVAGLHFFVENPEPDGHGLVLLRLKASKS